MRRVLAALALAAVAAPVAAAQTVPVTAGYTPQDKDERGLWQIMDDEEKKLKTSNFVMRDPALNAYVRDVFCRTVGPQCADVRIYLVRTPYFNASMAPNGMMVVYSGLFLRTRNEAQLAAVLGHEFTHYSGRHSVRLYRDIKDKTNTLAWLSIIPVGGLAAAGAMSVAQIGIIGSIGAFSREMERDADTGSVELLAKAGYDPMAASRIWEQLRAEMDATAAERGKRSQKDRDGGLFATHPPTAERMTDLKALAERQPPNPKATDGQDAYRRALAPHWPSFVNDQIKLNDFGATELLLANLASSGWTAELLFARGELYRSRGRTEDFPAAAGFYRNAIAAGDPPIEAWRGLGLSLLRSGAREDGRGALKEYLKRNPAASDRAMLAMLAGVQP
jgi:predicted Zn-dependent protease